MNDSAAVSLEDLQAGQQLPTLEVAVSTGSIVAGAIATRDFHPIHHDLDRVRCEGHAGLFLNIFSSNAYIERWIRSWSGPIGRIGQMDTRLGGPCYAGQVLRIAGSVTEVHRGPRGWVQVEVSMTCDATRHAHGSVKFYWH